MDANQQARLNNFDLLRLFAAIQVVIFHVSAHLKVSYDPSPLKWLIDLLGLFPGVPMFFAISGFLISKSYESKRDDLSGYFTNRALRIFPGLWICFAVSLITMLALGGLELSNLPTPSFLAYFVGQLSIVQFFTPSYLRDYGVGNPNGSLWTIPVELQFYVAIPVLYALGRSLKARSFDAVLSAVAIVSFGVGVFIEARDSGVAKILGISFLPHIWVFIVGVLVQRNFAQVHHHLVGKGLLWLSGFVVLKLLALKSGIAGAELATGAILAVATISLAYSSRDLSHRVLKGVDVSYGVYLYHMVIVNALVETGNVGPGFPVIAAYGLTVLAAVLSFLLVERPALALKNRFKPRVVKSGVVDNEAEREPVLLK